MSRWRVGWGVGLLVGLASAVTDNLVVIKKRVHSISPRLHGVFFEDINFAADGGLYAEMIWNRDFEAQGRGFLGGPQNPSALKGRWLPPLHGDMRPWAATGESGLEVSLTSATQPFKTNPISLRIKSASGGGVSNPGYWGINAREALPNNLSFFARSDEQTELEFRLVGQRKQALAQVTLLVNGPWQEYRGVLTPNASDPASVFEVRCTGACDVYLDHVSLFPGDAVRGLFRKDLFEMLQGIRPAFVRFPGGNYLEGTDLATRWAWKTTVGPRQARPGHLNSAWGYWVTDGMGLYEYLVLCEALEAEPQLSVYTGYSMGKAYVPLSQSGPFVQDAVDAVQFANGDASSGFGRVRSDAGHPDAFSLKLFEVGNEEADMANYKSHFKAISAAIRKAEPSATIIGSGRWGPPMAGNPCLTGERCDLWDDHYYRTPDEMANMSHVYDTYPRTLPKVFVGEYAANRAGSMTLQAALAEALFMIGFENNADVVRQASFAPLFAHVNGTQWVYDMILYNASAAFGVPSYHVQQLFVRNRGEDTLTLQGGHKLLNDATCSIGPDGTLTLKAVSYRGHGGLLWLTLPKGMEGYTRAEVFRLAGDPWEGNSLQEPLRVVPSVEHVRAETEGTFRIHVDPWCLLVISIPQEAVEKYV